MISYCMSLEIGNPFTPGFGVRPPLLAGRLDLVQQIQVDVRRGPGSPMFHHVVVGARGTGKTVLLAEVVDSLVSEHDAVIVWWTAGARDFESAVLDGVADSERTLLSKVRRGLRRLDVKVGVGVADISADLSSASPPQSAHAALARIARLAAARQRTVLLVVDEVQMATVEEVRALAGAIQELAQVRRLPLSLLAAGLPNAPTRLAAATFLERQALLHVGNLDQRATAEAIHVPIVDAGRTIDADALQALVDGSQGYPYAVQLMASYAWDASDGDSIDLSAATIGLVRGTAQLNEQLYATRWRLMTDLDRRYVVAVAECLDPGTGWASVSEVAAHLGTKVSSLSQTRDRLIRQHEVLASPGRNRLEFTLPGFAVWALAARPGLTRSDGGWHQPSAS